jgi:hypothetical protein
VQPHHQTPRFRVSRHSFEAKKATATDNSGLDLFETVPAIDTAVRVDNLGE